MYLMLTRSQTETLAREAQTTTDNVLKEHYQIFVLDVLYGSPFGGSLVFKGGTALRLVYNSFRFSEDLDFSLLKSLPLLAFKKAVGRVPRVLAEAKINDLYDKRNTLFARITFSSLFKPIPLGIKVEVNKDLKKIDYRAALIRSPFNNLEIVGQVYTLEQILKDKTRLLEERREPRDLFDAWYVSQKLGREFTVPPRLKYPARELKDNLNAFLPESKRAALSLFEK